MSQSKFVPEQRTGLNTPERRPAITPLPARADENMSRRQRQQLFEQVKNQVLDVANRHFEQTLRIIRRWLEDGPSR